MLSPPAEWDRERKNIVYTVLTRRANSPPHKQRAPVLNLLSVVYIAALSSASRYYGPAGSLTASAEEKLSIQDKFGDPSTQEYR
ncbi:hypothetical protein E2C01_044398 [Portunus trituberculatus]|uniref:Uncharacterized protein n=1 Tax=Portunus trituberculatus TaxID=210409 RepID=A0A5B7FZ80_PORTR|nr:hypothetical protein [Portunus trituberculatus]